MPDNRSKRQKLEELANHPRTPKTEADAARRALKKLGADTLDARPSDGQIRYADAQPSRPRNAMDDLAEAAARARDAAKARAPGGRTTGPSRWDGIPNDQPFDASRFGPFNRTYQGTYRPFSDFSTEDLLRWVEGMPPDVREAVRRRMGLPSEDEQPSWKRARNEAMAREATRRDKAEALRKQQMPPEHCPGCGHRSELHSSGVCYQCEYEGKAQLNATHCQWHYEYGKNNAWFVDESEYPSEPTYEVRTDERGRPFVYQPDIGWFQKEDNHE